MMPTQEIIDLSLSTDDELNTGKSPNSRAISSKDTQSITNLLPFLSDDFDTSLLLDESYHEQSAKRRKLSSPSYNEESLPKSTLPAAAIGSHKAKSPAALKECRAQKRPDEPDFIQFSSSPYDSSESMSKPIEITNLISSNNNASDDELPSDVYKISPKFPSLSTQLSKRTKALLAEISDNAKESRKRPFQGSKKASAAKKDRIISESEREHGRCTKKSSSSSRDETVKRVKLTSAERYARECVREQEKARKAKEKEDARERKRLEKEEKAREKQIAADLTEVNKARTDRKITTPEMIVDLPASIRDTTLETQTRAFLEDLNVCTTTYESPVPHVIKWRRKVDCTFDEEKGHWIRVPESIEKEKNIACLLAAKEFVSLATTSSTERECQSLEAHILRLKSHFPDSSPIYLIEGLDTWMRKNKNSRNRAYQAAVLKQTGVNVTSSKRKKPAEEIVDEDIIEDALLQLQVVHSCQIHHTVAAVQTAGWIAIFTQHISQIPYRFACKHQIP